VEEPKGILNSKAAVKQPRAKSNEIHYVDILNMQTRMPGQSKQNAAFIINQEVTTQLGLMTTTTDGTGYPVYLPANGASGLPYATLMGRPVIETEHASALGTTGDISLVDWSQYLIGQKAGVVGNGVQVMSSIHLDFDRDLVAFKFRIRLDGQCWWPQAIKPKKGTKTLSPIVLLDSATS
jgi:HK97 family phage major capsid protein